MDGEKKDRKGTDWEEEESLGIEICMLCIFIVRLYLVDIIRSFYLLSRYLTYRSEGFAG